MAEAPEGGEEPQRQVVAPLEEEALEARRAAFKAVFADLPAQEVKQKSRAEREAKEMDENASKSLAYSEIDFDVLHRLLDEVATKHGPLYVGEGTFLDLGSGVGKACLAAGLLHPFQKVVGVEVLDALAEAGNGALAKCNDPEQVQWPQDVPKPDVQLLKGDFAADFEAQVEPIAKDVTVCLALSSCYGEEQLKAMTKLANLMPEGSVFITFTHAIAESLIIDVNRQPKKRRAAATKRALAKRGLEPQGVEVVLDPAENDPAGWRQVFKGQMQLEWGTPTVFMFKKHLYPYCYPGDLCVVTLLEEAQDPADPAPRLALYAERANVQEEEGQERTVLRASLLEDAFGEPCEVAKIAPFDEEDRKKALAKFKALAGLAERAVLSDAESAVGEALAAAATALGAGLDAGAVPHAAEGAPTEECKVIGQNLVPALGPLGEEAWVGRFVAGAWPEEVLKLGQGAATVTKETLTQAWVATRSRLHEFIQDRLKKVETHVPP